MTTDLETEIVRQAAVRIVRALEGLTNHQGLGALALASGTFLVETTKDAPEARRYVHDAFLQSLKLSIAIAHTNATRSQSPLPGLH